jgi:hypothetical protein
VLFRSKGFFDASKAVEPMDVPATASDRRAFSFVLLGDLHVPHTVCHALAGEDRGFGEPAPVEHVRAAMLSRIAVHARGYSGCRPEITQTYVALLNAGVTPIACEKGSVGACGDLAPMSQIALSLMGEGECFYRGERLATRVAMERAQEGVRSVVERIQREAKKSATVLYPKADDLDAIASGPTVPDTTTFSDALGIVRRYGIEGKLPAPVANHLRSGIEGGKDAPAETPKPGDPLFERVDNHIIASNIHAANAALAQAQAEGLHTLLLTTFLQGEARQAGGMLAAICRQVLKSGQPIPKPACIIAGGETTVSVHGSGLGGRNRANCDDDRDRKYRRFQQCTHDFPDPPPRTSIDAQLTPPRQAPFGATSVHLGFPL